MGIKKNLKRGFTLVELMIVVAIIGILAALAIYGVRRYVTNAKTSEARNSLGGISKAAAMAFDRETMPGQILGAHAESETSSALCGPMAASVPATAPAGKKWQSEPNDWGGDFSTGWKCLMFSMEAPQYFAYGYTSDATRTARGVSGAKFTATAAGDLDGDSATSLFTLEGEVYQDPATNELSVKASPSIIEQNPDE